jgi:cytochrome P450
MAARPITDPVTAPATNAGLGATFQPLAGDHLEDPYPFYRRARAEEPVFFHPGFGLWFVTRYEDVVAVLRDPRTFSSKDTIPTHPELAPEVQAVLAEHRHSQHLINADPPVHTRLRSICNEGFTPTRVGALESTIRALAADLIDGFSADGHADIAAQFAYPLPLTVILQMLGVPAEDLDDCRRWSHDVSAWAWGAAVLPTEQLVEHARGMVAFQRYTEGLVEARRRGPRADMISDLVAARDGGTGLSNEEVVDLVPGLILAGHETTANLITNTLFQLLRHPARWDVLRRDPRTAEAAVEEGLRFDTSVLGMPRTTTRDVELGGVTLPAGAKLFVLFGSAGHDDARYANPEAFDPDRRGGPPHLGFGRGIHYCIGSPLARLEARIALATLAARLPSLRLVDREPPPHRPMLAFREYTRLDVEWDR